MDDADSHHTMNGFRKLFRISAVLFIVLGLMLAIAVIAGIWLEFDHPAVWKSIGTLAVLFFVSGFLHVVAKGMIEKPRDKL